MFGQVIVAVFAISIIALQWHKRKYMKLYSEYKPKKPGLPIVGHALVFAGNGEGTGRMEFFKWAGREALDNGGLMSAWLLHKLVVAIADPEAAEVVLKTCLDKGPIMNLMRSVYDNASLVAPVEIWRLRRKINAPTFSPRNLSRFVQIFSKQSGVMVEQLRTKTGKGPFPMAGYLNTYTFDSICESTLGVQVGLQKNPDHPFFEAVEVSFDMVAARMVKPWLYSEKIYNMLYLKKLTKFKEVMTRFVNQIIRSNLRTTVRTNNDEQNQKENKNGYHRERTENLKTFLDLIIESSKYDQETGYSEVEMQEEALQLVVAATDTTAVGLSVIVAMLSQYPDVQEKVYQELKEVFGDSSRPVVNEDLPQLKYLDAVIRESIRLYPPAPIIIREVDKDVTLPSGVTLLAGITAVIHTWAINRNPRYWGPDAEEFRPDRFVNKFKHPAQFMTFSYGPRNCIGYRYAMMSMKTSLANLIRQYRVLPTTPRDAASNCNGSKQHRPLRLKWDVIMKDVDNCLIELEIRQ